MSSNTDYLSIITRLYLMLLRHTKEQLRRLYDLSTCMTLSHYSPMSLLHVLAREAVLGQIGEGYFTEILCELALPTLIFSK